MKVYRRPLSAGVHHIHRSPRHLLFAWRDYRLAINHGNAHCTKGGSTAKDSRIESEARRVDRQRANIDLLALQDAKIQNKRALQGQGKLPLKHLSKYQRDALDGRHDALVCVERPAPRRRALVHPHLNGTLREGRARCQSRNDLGCILLSLHGRHGLPAQRLALQGELRGAQLNLRRGRGNGEGEPWSVWMFGRRNSVSFGLHCKPSVHRPSVKLELEPGTNPARLAATCSRAACRPWTRF